MLSGWLNDSRMPNTVFQDACMAREIECFHRCHLEDQIGEPLTLTKCSMKTLKGEGRKVLTQRCSIPSARSMQRGTVSAELLSCDCTGMPAGLFTTQKSSSRCRTLEAQSVVLAAG